MQKAKYSLCVLLAGIAPFHLAEAAVMTISDTFSITYSQPSGPLTATGFSGSYSATIDPDQIPTNGEALIFDLDSLSLSTDTFGVNTFDLSNTRGVISYFGPDDQLKLTIGGFTGTGSRSERVDIGNIDTDGDWRLLYWDILTQTAPAQVDYGAGGEGYYRNTGITGNLMVNVIPIPAAVWLFASALIAMGMIRRPGEH